MKLSAQERMALAVVRHFGGRLTGAELGDHLMSSERTGRRVLQSLTDKGLISRISRGKYRLHQPTEVAAERPIMAAERSIVAVPVLVGSSSTNDIVVEDPNGSSTPAARGAFQEEIFRTEMFPLIPGRLTDDEPSPHRKRAIRTATPPTRDDMSTWTTNDAVAEFHKKAQYALQKSIFVVDRKELTVLLNTVRRDHGLSVGEIVQVMDGFFSDKVKSTPDGESPVRFFMTYLRDYIFRRPVESKGHYDDWNSGW